MVKVKENTPWLSDGTIDVEMWLNQLASKGYVQDLNHIRSACALSQLSEVEHATETGVSCLQQGLSIADILADLEVDQETLTAAIIYGNVYYRDLSIEDVQEQLGLPIAKLVKGVEKMNAINTLQNLNKFSQNKLQIDNIRKMLLAMVDDVRVVLIKLAERLFILRASSHLPEDIRKQMAREAMDIYAPLANRLGIGAVKWEMEDLAFRFLHPEDYKAIAKGLKAKRLERDKYVDLIVEELNKKIASTGATHFAVYGRSKHIHSIYKKMQRKNVSLDEIYDATAVRILLQTVEQCYDVLSVVHSLWKQITAEFDDYIMNPKPNGYQSLHTAVEGPEGRVFEVQIRTFQMHDLAEMGVAAHWKYKEGVQQKESYERKIDWLRSVLAWHKEMATSSGISEAIETEFLEDRVYVFTPDGDVLDLPHGVTPLDFAYHVHSQLGHRCRGSKVNGHIVPLTYVLKTGDRVEILTGKEARPSRDWMNPHLNYLKTSRAKAKVLHWFKLQDYDKNKAEGQALLEKELKSLGVKNNKLQNLAIALNFKHTDDMLAALGRGELKIGHILHRLTAVEIGEKIQIPSILKSYSKPEITRGDLHIEGVGNLLTNIARCCQPVPGDAVVGYITIGRGVSIHRTGCPNIIHSSEKQKQRFLQVTWGDSMRDHYIVDILISAFDRTGLLRDITSLLSSEKAHVYALETQTDKQENTACIKISVEINGLHSLSRLLSKLEQIPNVFEARRHV